MYKLLKNKSILITGGTGSFGKFCAEFLINKTDIRKVIIFSRDEFKQYNMIQELSKKKNFNKLRFFLGDVRDLKRLEIAFRDVDFVIHAAALKHVDAAEYNPIEYVQTNIIGTQNIILASLSNKVKKVIGLSTDKAVNPINLYGSTKLAADKLVLAANNYTKKNECSFSVVRYGNVMNSRGSVIPKFNELKKNNAKYFPITDKKMTRFIISIESAVKFVLDSMTIMKGFEIFVPKCKTIKINDLAKALDYKKPIKIIGIRPGEKMHEYLLSEEETAEVYEYKSYYILKYFHTENGQSNKSALFSKKSKIIKSFNYSSENNNRHLSIKEIKKIIPND